MGMIGRFTQQPGENIKRIMDYSAWLESAETILNVVPTVLPATAVPFVITSVFVDSAGKKFAYYGGGGETGVTYMVTFRVHTSIAQIREDEVEYDIEEVE